MLASSSSTSPPRIKHEVFINFRGDDTRSGFTGFLYAALRRTDIKVFIDEHGLGKGDEITPSLEEAIEASLIYVAVFSENYASSRWCLSELEKILECKNKYGRDVIPVFYKVDPSNVRHQNGSYADAFVNHEQRCNHSLTQSWKLALTQVAGLSGWDSKNYSSEYQLVEDIAADIVKKVSLSFQTSSNSQSKGLVGIQKHIEQIQKLSQLDSPAVRVIGIWGIGGIGKSTIAAAVYHKLAPEFQSSALVLNAEKVIHVWGKSLLVVDDLDDVNIRHNYGRRYSRLEEGSRIILASRDLQVLKNANADEIYEVKGMNFQDSLELFSLHAFKQNHPIETFVDLSKKVLNYAKGVPLALKVLGLLLYGRTEKDWESELGKLKKFPEHETFKVLKLSYDGLDDEQKDIFLDIACFYRGHDVNTVKQILEGCGFSAGIGTRVLIDRGLMSISEKEEIVMHDLIQEMGQEIVRREGVNDPGKRSRLWKPEDIYRVLKKNKGTDAVKCMFLNMCQIKEIQLDPQTFKMMDNLRMLYFYDSHKIQDSNLHIQSSLESLPDELRFVHWDSFPQRSLPLDFDPENLVELYMRNSKLEIFLERDQHLPNLKRLDLSRSLKLRQIPDLAGSPNIEQVILKHCKELNQVYSSAFLSKLNCILLKGCTNLRNLSIPSNVLSTSYGFMDLQDCSNLETFSVSMETMWVPLSGCSRYWRPVEREIFKQARAKSQRPLFEKVLRPALSLSRKEVCRLNLSYCASLTSLPTHICKLKFLRTLNLLGCSNLEKFPEIEEPMENLMELILDESAIRELPLSLHHLVGLQRLSLSMCPMLEFIPPSIGCLTQLCRFNITCCESLEALPSSIFKLKLTKLDLSGCLMLRTFPDILEPSETFSEIILTKTAIKQVPPSIDYLVGLKTLRLKSCSDLELLPNSIVNLKHLTELHCSGCAKLTEIPSDIGRLSSLRELSLVGSGIVNLPESIAHLASLKLLDLSDCKKLECIPQLPKFLKKLLACDCSSLRTVTPNSRIEKLPSDSKENVFEFCLTNSEELDPSAHSNIVADAWLRVTEDAYRSVFFCFPGSAVPDWFHCRGSGRLVTMNTDFQNRPCSANKLIGFALCVVLRSLDVENGEALLSLDDFRSMFKFGFDDDDFERISKSNSGDDFGWILKFASDDGKLVTVKDDSLRRRYHWKAQQRNFVKDHTFVWKYLMESSNINHMLSHALKFTFEIRSNPKSTVVKECGICPLYAKEKDGNNGVGDSSNDIDEQRRSRVLHGNNRKWEKEDL